MPVVNLKSTAVAAGDMASQTLTSQLIDGARLRERVGFSEVATTDSISSIYRLIRVNSGDRISRLLLSNDAITTGAASIGLYDIESVNLGGVIDVNFFASAQSLATAQANFDVTHRTDPADAATEYGLADVEKPLWMALGLSRDPGKQYDIALTLTAAGTAAGTVVLRLQYVNGN